MPLQHASSSAAARKATAQQIAIGDIAKPAAWKSRQLIPIAVRCRRTPVID
jgi:hypothetical protein